jgi:carboxypeptidase Taq
MSSSIAALRAEAERIWDIRTTVALLMWDQQTAMPAAAAGVRSRQLASAEGALQARYGSGTVGRLLAEVERTGSTRDAREAALVRVLRHEHDKANRVPRELREALAEAAALGQRAWVEARDRASYSDFLPALRRNIELRRRYAECFPELDDPYDAHLDDYEPGMRTSEVAPVIAELKQRLIPLARDVRDRVAAVPLAGPFEPARQHACVRDLLGRIGLDTTRARIVESPHPLTIAMGVDDVGITTRYAPSDLDGVFLALHEIGHALYEQGFDRAIAGTPLAQGASAAIHEAQARLFENLVGRSRAFWTFALPRLRQAFPDALGGVGLDEFDEVVNGVRNSAVRLRADELTYSLHIILRFELERAMLAGELSLEDLPAAWAARTESYLGLPVPDDARGVLQDVHWALGAFGYFPTYALGNVIAVQLWQELCRCVPDVENEIAGGDFGSVRGWLGDRVWRHGRCLPPDELLRRAVGCGLDPAPYAAYLERKFRTGREAAAAAGTR